MGKYLQLLDRAAQEHSRDKSDQSDKRLPIDNAALPFGRICRFGRNPETQASENSWTDTEEERAAVVEYDAPRAWAEALARVDPNRPPSDVPAQRWLRFIDDCGLFLDDGWPERATALGWGPLDLFGCDRERPFARYDHKGLLWLVNGGTIVELQRDRAIIESASGVRQSYRRRPVEVGRIVLAWELADAGNPKRRAVEHGSPAKT